VSATTTPGLCEVEMEMFMQPAIFVPPVIRSVVGMQVSACACVGPRSSHTPRQARPL
jgi:hypothetical protein